MYLAHHKKYSYYNGHSEYNYSPTVDKVVNIVAVVPVRITNLCDTHNSIFILMNGVTTNTM